MSTLNVILGALMAAEDRVASHSSDPDATRKAHADNAVRRAVLGPTALPLLGRWADDDGPLERAPAPRPQGNRRQRRANRHRSP